MKLKRIAIYTAAALGVVLVGRTVYNPSVSVRAGGHVTFLSLSIQSPYSSKVAKRLLVPSASPEEPEWLTKAQNDPDPRIRLNAIKAWVEIPQRVSIP